MNKIILIGNLTRDPDLTETPSGVSVCKFSIAVKRNIKNSDGEYETDFFNCTAWRGTAEAIGRYCSKGNKVCVIGSAQMRSYEDNKGVKQTVMDIIVQEVEFLTKKEAKENTEVHNTAEKPKPKQSTLFDYDDDDIPF